MAWNYQGSAWVVYDWLYQKWALSQQRLDWMQEDTFLYYEVFSDQTRVIMTCQYYLSKFHATEMFPNLLPTLPLWPHQLYNKAWSAPFPPSLIPGGVQKVQLLLVQDCKHCHVCLGLWPHPSSSPLHTGASGEWGTPSFGMEHIPSTAPQPP